MPLFNLNAELRSNKIVHLKEMLLEFTISTLLDQPDCIYPYAVNYFAKKQEGQSAVFVMEEEKESETDDEETSESLEELPVRFRNKSVFAERFNPESEEDDDYDGIPVFSKTWEERELIYVAIRKCILFRAVDDVYMDRIIDAMQPRKVVADEWIIKQGDDGNHFYVIEKGTFEAWMDTEENSEPELIVTYEDFGSFGELALMYNQPRSASVKAVTEGVLWMMDRITFKKLVLSAIYRKRRLFEDLVAKVHILGELQPYERSSLADAMEERRFQSGDVIIAQGDEADGMYFLVDGAVSVTMENPETHQRGEVTVLKEGEYFGELALVTHEPRAATVTAIEKTKVAFLDKETFERILGPCLDIMARNMEGYKEQTSKLFGETSVGRT